MRNKIIDIDVEQINKLTNDLLEGNTISNISRLGGLTNHSYKVELENGSKYVFRLPGEGTSELINRSDEKVSTELAFNLGIDANLIFFDDEGVKICEYIENAVTLDAQSLRKNKTIRDVAKIFSTLHNCGIDTKVPFEVFEMAENYETIIKNYNVDMYDDYDDIKMKVMNIKKYIEKDTEIVKVPCHNDSLCENWIYGNDRLYLIDWEYAGMNDPMWDLADISIEANYNEEHDDLLLYEYFKKEPTLQQKQRFIANKLYLDYLWTLWGKTRVPFDGDSMEQYALNRYIRLKENIKKFEDSK